MATLTISLPDGSRDWLEEQVRSGQFATADQYLEALIERDRDERPLTLDELHELLDEAEASGISERSVDEIAAEAKAIALR